MKNSLLAAVHAAVAGSVDDVLNEDETSAPALNATTGKHSMKTSGEPAGGDQTGISKADHDAGVTAARAEGVTAGATAATERLSAALGAEGIKGDAGRMAAALDLAVKSPGMSGVDVAAFITANVSAAKPGATGAADYAAQRSAASGLAAPQKSTAEKSDKTALASAVATTNKRR